MAPSARLIGRAAWLVLLFSLLTAAACGSALAQQDSDTDRLIAEGRLVYDANCAACHETDGSGVPGVFPPLLGNPAVNDDEYVRDVVLNGLSGEIEVLGEIYNEIMFNFALLEDDQVTALIVYLQEGLGTTPPPAEPEPPPTDASDTPPPADDSNPLFTYGLAFLVGLVGIGIVIILGPKVLASGEGWTSTRWQTWLKASVIVLYFTIATVFIPSEVVESGALASPPSFSGDSISADQWDTIRSLIATGVWAVALGVGMWGLRRLQRNRVI